MNGDSYNMEIKLVSESKSHEGNPDDHVVDNSTSDYPIRFWEKI